MSVPHDQEYQAITTSSAAVSTTAITMAAFGFTAADLAAATRAVVSTHNSGSGGVSYSYDGIAPTNTSGHNLDKTDLPTVLWGNVQINNLQFIRDHQGTDGVVTITLETTQGGYAITTTTAGGTTTTSGGTTTTSYP
tara:strand:- start:102 stop:512 length:411 start_codon:yes stop_codon:yes gene_type:complete